MDTTTRIAPKHENTLTKAGIPIDDAKAWGIFSVTVPSDFDKTDLGHHRGSGFTGLCFPLRMADGSVTYQLRLDDEYVTPERGKYLQAAGLGAILNVPESRQHLIGNATKVIVTEGTKQTIAATLYSEPDVLVIGIQGCHNFSRAGVPLPEIAQLISPAAAVTLIFDADWVSNAAVWQAAFDLKGHLEDAIGVVDVKVATVSGGGKMGLDDFLGTLSVSARPGALERLVAKAKTTLGRKPKAKVKADVKTSSKLFVDMEAGVITREIPGGDGFSGGGAARTEIALAAAARIIEAEAHIDEEAGEASSQRLKLEVAVRVEGQAKPVLRTVKVDSAKLASTGDWLDRLPGGLGVTIPRSSKPDDDVANAIREASTDITNVSVVPHTGWTFDDEDNEWRWLDGAGAIGANDKVTRLRGEPASRDFQNINLPDPTSIPEKELVTHIRSFVMARQLLNTNKMFSWDAAVAGWGLAFLGVTPNATLCYFGPPSSGKSTLAQGTASSLNPGWAPRTGSAMATFNSRPAGMDLLPNGLRDCFLHVDDLKPESDQQSMKATLKAFDALLRRSHGSGGAVRGGVDKGSDSLIVRGVDNAAPFMIITGEEIPSGDGFAESGLDRALFILVEPKTQFATNDTLHQFEELAKRGNWRYVTAAYLTWLAELINTDAPDDFDDTVEPARRLAAWQDHIEKQRSALTLRDGQALFPKEVKVSDRATLLAASLVTGYRHVLTFALQSGAITDAEHDQLLEEFGTGLHRQVLDHTTHVMGGNATGTEQALARLRNAISSGQVVFAGDEASHKPIIGEVRDDIDGRKCVIINHSAAADALKYTGGPRALQRALADVSLTGSDGKNTRTLNVNGARVQVCVIPLSVWADGDETAAAGATAASEGF